MTVSLATARSATTITTKNKGIAAGRLRRLCGQSLLWVGQRVGVSESRLCRYEQGVIELPREKQDDIERVLMAAVRKRAAEISRLLASAPTDGREKERVAV